MTATGKTDRMKLRDIGGTYSVEQLAKIRTALGPKRQPVSNIQQKLQAIWASVLEIDSKIIGLDDSLFHLGGDSITTDSGGYF